MTLPKFLYNCKMGLICSVMPFEYLHINCLTIYRFMHVKLYFRYPMIQLDHRQHQSVLLWGNLSRIRCHYDGFLNGTYFVIYLALVNPWTISIHWMVTCEFLQNSIMRHSHNNFDCLKLQICKSIIDISISYPFTYSNIIRNI